MRLFFLCFALLFLTLYAQGQPAIRATSVVNAANNLQAGLPNAGLAQGGMFILKGRNLGARGTVVANSFPLGTTMGGSSMKITAGGTTVNVLMVYVVGGLSDDQGAFDQLAGIVPSNTPTGSGTLTATFNNQTSAPVAVTILANGFGIFTISQNGSGPGVFTDPNFKVSTLINAAHAGDLLFIWGTGLGAISGSDANAPPVGSLNVPAEVYVGGIKAAIGYQGRSGCCSGIDQILITIPPGVQGCYVSVVVKIGSIVSNFATVAVAPSGSICSDPTGFSAADLQKAQTNAALTLADLSVVRFSAKLIVPGGPLQGNLDQGFGYFQKYSVSPSGVLAALPPFLPTAGCVVYNRPDDGTALLDNLTLSPRHDFVDVDGGPVLNVGGPQGAKQMLRQNNGGDFRYKADLGGGISSLFTAGPEYLVPGNYTLNNGGGGADVGGFSTSLTVPNALANPWANQDAVFNIPRSQDLSIALNPPGDNFFVGIFGNSEDSSIGQNVVFNCVVPPGATSFTIPSYVMSAMPASAAAGDFGGAKTGFLAVVVVSANASRIQARGVDGGTFSWGQFFVKNVNFQ